MATILADRLEILTKPELVAKRAKSLLGSIKNSSSKERRRQKRCQLTVQVAAGQGYICPFCREMLDFWEHKPGWLVRTSEIGIIVVHGDTCATSPAGVRELVTLEPPSGQRFHVVPISAREYSDPGYGHNGRLRCQTAEMPDDGGGAWVPPLAPKAIDSFLLGRVRKIEIEIGTPQLAERLRGAFAANRSLSAALGEAVVLPRCEIPDPRKADQQRDQRERTEEDLARFGIDDNDIYDAFRNRRCMDSPLSRSGNRAAKKHFRKKSHKVIPGSHLPPTRTDGEREM